MSSADSRHMEGEWWVVLKSQEGREWEEGGPGGKHIDSKVAAEAKPHPEHSPCEDDPGDHGLALRTLCRSSLLSSALWTFTV